jgi:hypothetical protein
VVIEPLRDFMSGPRAAERLAHLLETMPEAVARYKGMADVRVSLLGELRRAPR